MTEYNANFSDRSFRRWLMNRLKLNQALEPSDEMYEPFYAGDSNNPVRLLFNDIDLSEKDSLNFISGFRGSGKTTELFRLRSQLVDEGYFVTYANALDFVLPSEPVEIIDFLLVMAGAFSAAIEESCGLDPLTAGYWTRFVDFLTKTNVELEGFEFGVTEAGLNFKTSLQQDKSFRQQLRTKLSGRLGEVKKHVQEFFKDGRELILENKGQAKVVFIFDQFEQIRDTSDTKGQVAESITTLLANHRRDLAIPDVHVVLTVPPWLKLRLSEFQGVRLLYNVKLWNNDKDRSVNDEGWCILRNVVEKRFTSEGMKRFFGEPDDGKYELAEKIIEASGGHLRDLIRLLRECLLRATNMPLDHKTVDGAIAGLRDSFLPIYFDDAKLLHDIGRRRNCLLPNSSHENISRMTMFLDQHIALILRNGEEWYDLHPLVRSEVDGIISKNPELADEAE